MKSVALAFLALTAAATAMATTIRVPTDEPTIQAGIDAASAGDTVLVAPGTYTGIGNRDIDFGGKDVVLTSEGGAVSTIIDLETLAVGLIFDEGETNAAIVEGFTIERSIAEGFGGAFICTGASRCRSMRSKTNNGALERSEGVAQNATKPRPSATATADSLLNSLFRPKIMRPFLANASTAPVPNRNNRIRFYNFVPRCGRRRAAFTIA